MWACDNIWTYYIHTKFSNLCNSKKTDTNWNVNISQPLIKKHLWKYIFYESSSGRLMKNTSILCNRSFSLLDFEGHLMSLFLHKGLFTSTSHYISMVRVCNLFYQCHDGNINKIKFNNFFICNAVYILLFCELRRKHHTQHVPPEYRLPLLLTL